MMPPILHVSNDESEKSEDIKSITRELVGSETYQLACTGRNTEALPQWFERARVRPLTAEEIVSSLYVATGTAPDPKNPNANWEYFLRAFGEPTNGLGEFQGSLSEHLFWNNHLNLASA